MLIGQATGEIASGGALRGFLILFQTLSVPGISLLCALV